MLKTRKNQKGFTLTELIIVIVIIGILAAVLIPTLSSYVERAKKSAAEQNAMSVYQEWVAKDGRTEEEIAELLDKTFVVENNSYYVVIRQGGVKASSKTPYGFASDPAPVDYSYTGSNDTTSSDDYRQFSATGNQFNCIHLSCEANWKVKTTNGAQLAKGTSLPE